MAEALVDLGLDQQADAQTARRAYLRAIKVRKPESDPVGFQRAREAYEIVCARSAKLTAVAGEAPSNVPGPSPSTEPSDSQIPSSPNDAAIEGFTRAWLAVPSSAGRAPRLEIAQEAVAALPADPRAHWLLVTTLAEQTGTDRLRAEALRTAWRATDQQFLEELLIQLPTQARPEEIGIGLKSESASLQLAAAAALAPREPGRALATVMQVIQALREQPPLPYLDRVLAVILALFENEDPTPALTAIPAVRAWIGERDAEKTIVASPLAATWILTDELAALPEGFPAELRKVLASSVRSRSLNAAEAWVVDDDLSNGRQMRRWRKRLGRRTPNIASLMDAGLRSSRFQKRLVAGSVVGSIVGFLLMVTAIAGLRHCHARFWPDTPARSGTSLRAEAIQQAAADLCNSPVASDYGIPCSTAKALATAVVAKKCNVAGVLFHEARKSIRARAPLPLEAAFLEAAAVGIGKTCPRERLPSLPTKEKSP